MMTMSELLCVGQFIKMLTNDKAEVKIDVGQVGKRREEE